MEQETENKETGNLADASNKADDHEAVPSKQLSGTGQNLDVDSLRLSTKTSPFEEINNGEGDAADEDPVEEDPIEEDLVEASDVQIPKDDKVETENPVEDSNVLSSKEDTCEIENLAEASKKALSREIKNKTENLVEASNAALSIEINNGTGNLMESNTVSSNIETKNPVEPSNTSASKNNGENLLKAQTGAESSKKGTPKSLKARPKVVKKKTSASMTLQKAEGLTSKNVNSLGNKSHREDMDSGIPNSANKQKIEISHEINKKQGKKVALKRNIQKQKAEGENKGDDVNSKKPSSGGESTQTGFANEHPTDRSIEEQEAEKNKNKDEGAKDPASGGDSRQENAANDSLVEGGEGSNKKRKRIMSLQMRLKQKPEMTRDNKDANAMNSSQGEEKRQNNDVKRQQVEKGQEAKRKEEKEKGNKNSSSEQKRKAEDQPGGSNRNAKNQRNAEKLNSKQKSKKDGKKKEKLGGLIFMCSKKTKPDCFRYHVMGMNMNRKDLVLGIKPGLKLFLYDFDRKLMYGIYKASSSGGLKLEPRAFGGGFPVQVHFSVLKDCNPLPESTFKKAIKENYDKKNKFSAELTVRQAKKLSALFQPVALLKPNKSVQSLPVAPTRDREPYDGVREPRSRSDREVFVRDDNGKNYHSREVAARKRDVPPRDLFLSEREYRTYGLPRERRQLSPPRIPLSADLYVRDRKRQLSPPRVPPSVDLYMRDRERQVSPPRSYVMDRERRLSPHTYMIDREGQLSPHHIPASIDPYSRNRERELQLSQSNSIYRERVPYQRESAYVDSHYPTASGSGVSMLSSHARGSHYSHRYGADAYLPSHRREEVPSTSYYADGRRAAYLDAADPVKRTETDCVDRLYSRHAVEAPSNRRQVEYERVNPETASLPVSSRYSFGSPSLFL